MNEQVTPIITGPRNGEQAILARTASCGVLDPGAAPAAYV